MARIDTTKDTTTPTIRMISSVELKAKPNSPVQKTCSEHNRNCQEKGKFCCNRTGCSCKDSSDNGRTGTGCSRDHGKHLEAADDQRCLKGKLIQSGAGWSAALL